MEAASDYERMVPKSIKYIENYGAKLFIHGRRKKRSQKKAQEM